MTCLDQYTAAIATRPFLLGGGADLFLNNLNLQGTLPYQLQELQTSVNLQFFRNQLTGTLPQSWGQAPLTQATLFSSPPPPAPPPLPPMPPLATGLVLYLTLDGAPNSSVAATVTTSGQMNYSSGVSNLALLYAPTVPPTAAFVPVTASLTAAVPVAATSTSPFSITAWVFLNESSVGLYQTALSLFSGTYPVTATTGAGAGGAFMLQFNPSYGQNTVTALLLAAPYTPLAFTPPAPATFYGAWTHFALVASSTAATLYVNGLAVDTATYTNLNPMTSARLLVGAAYDGTAGFWGALDEARGAARLR